MVLRSGLLKRTAAATLTFPAAPDSVAAPVAAEADGETPWLPILAVGVAILLLLALLGWYLIRRRLVVTPGRRADAPRTTESLPRLPG